MTSLPPSTKNMASPAKDLVRSPFSSVLNNLPEGHEKAVKQAIYTTAANLFIVLAIGAAVAVYFIMEVFLRPLLWAVLCGTFLYPFKRSLTSCIRSWLHDLQTSNRPMAIGVCLIPIRTVDIVYEKFYSKISDNLYLLVGGSTAIFLSYLMWNFGPVQSLINCVISVFYFVYDVLGYFTSFWVRFCLCLLFRIVCFKWHVSN